MTPTTKACMWGLNHHSRAIRRKCISLNGKNCTFTWSLPKKVLKSCGRHVWNSKTSTSRHCSVTENSAIPCPDIIYYNKHCLAILPLIFVSRLQLSTPFSLTLLPFLLPRPVGQSREKNLMEIWLVQNSRPVELCGAQQPGHGGRDHHPAKIHYPGGPSLRRVIANPIAPCSERSSS